MNSLICNPLRETAGSTVFLASRMISFRFCGKEGGKRGKHGFPSLPSRSHVGLNAAGSGISPFRGIPVSRAGHVEGFIGDRA